MTCPTSVRVGTRISPTVGEGGLIGTYNLLDLVPKGRDENTEYTMNWVRYHDRYDQPADAVATR